MAPGLTAAQAVPSLVWGLNSLTLPGPSPVPSPWRPLQRKTRNHFKSPLAARAARHTLHLSLPVFPGFRDPPRLLSRPLDERNSADFSPKSPSSSRGLGLPRSEIQPSHSSTPGRPELRSFPGQAPALRKVKTRGSVQGKMRGDRKDKLFCRFRFLRKGWRV